MWRTSIADRVLRGAEARLFALGALRLLPKLGAEIKEPGVSAVAFYRLSRNQKAVVLCEVVEALFRKSIKPPAHTAVNEAAIAAVFDGVQGLLGDEIDDGIVEGGTEVRDLLRRIMWRHGEGVSIPAVIEDEVEEWDFCMETLRDRILWDRDFEDDPSAGMSETQTIEFLSQMGIASEYFAKIPGVVPEPVARLLEDRIRALCEAIV